MKTITTIHRFQKGTIKSADWFIEITETNNNYTMWKGLLRKDDLEIIKETTKDITKEEAISYISENKYYHIETYQTTL